MQFPNYGATGRAIDSSILRSDPDPDNLFGPAGGCREVYPTDQQNYSLHNHAFGSALDSICLNARVAVFWTPVSGSPNRTFKRGTKIASPISPAAVAAAIRISASS